MCHREGERESDTPDAVKVFDTGGTETIQKKPLSKSTHFLACMLR